MIIEPKSHAGRRTVPMIRHLRELLAIHQGDAAIRTGLVFATARRRAPAPNVINRRAYAAWAAASLARIGLHEARHTYASLPIAAGVNANAITVYMGHSSIKVTFDLYGHLMPGNENEAALMLEAYLTSTGHRDGTSAERSRVADGPADGPVLGQSYNDQGGSERTQAET